MRRAFTLIEMMVVIGVLTLMAAFITPNLVALQRSRTLRSLEAAVVRLPSEAREEARRLGKPVVLRVEDSALVVEQKATKEEDATELMRLSLGSEIQVDQAQTNGESVELSSWEWTIYPDGTSRPATLILREGQRNKSLLFSSEGDARWAVSDTDTTTEERWEAGGLEQRA